METLVELVRDASKQAGMDSQLAQLAERLLHDKSPVVRYAYLFAETRDNQVASFAAAKELQQAHKADYFSVIDADAANGFPGYEAWRKELGPIVGPWSVLRVPVGNRKGVNTQSESIALVKQIALSKAIRADCPEFDFWYAIAPQFHILRAFMTLASEIINSDKDVSVFSYPAPVQDWEEQVTHSQGILIATRAQLVYSEIERINAYKNILPAEEIMRYMDQRALPK